MEVLNPYRYASLQYVTPRLLWDMETSHPYFAGCDPIEPQVLNKLSDVKPFVQLSGFISKQLEFKPINKFKI